jgi:hypothetical protein
MQPQHIVTIVQQLSDGAKTKINKLKFGSMLKIKLHDFPNGLIVDLMDCCEVTPEGMQLVVGEYKIMVTPQLVKDVLGLPLGKEDVVIEIPQKMEIMDYFGITKGPKMKDDVTATDIIKQMATADMLKQVQGFFTVLFNKLLCPETTAYIRGADFNATSDDMDTIPEKNWCKYVCDKLVDSVKCWHNQKVKVTTTERFVPGCGIILLVSSF